MKYQKPYGVTDPDAAYVNGDPSIARQGSIPPGEAIEHPQRELVDLITRSGLAPSETDLGQAAKAIQTGKIHYGVAGGTANAITAALSPVPAAYTAGMTVRIKIATKNPSGGTTISLNGLGFVSIVHPDGAALADGDLMPGMVAELVHDGAAFQLVGAPLRLLTANRDYYVNPATGSDANAGDLAHPFATVQHALDIVQTFNMNGYDVTVHMADYLAGTYAPFNVNQINGAGNLIIVGNDTYPERCVVSNDVGGSAVKVFSRNVILHGFRVQAAASIYGDPGIGLRVAGGHVVAWNIDLGACAYAHVNVESAGFLVFAGQVTNPAYFVRVTGASPITFQATSGATLQFQRPILTIVATFTSTTFARAEMGQISGDGIGVFSTINNPGNISGQRYQALANGVINTGGLGASYFPGTVAGTTPSGGQYL